MKKEGVGRSNCKIGRENVMTLVIRLGRPILKLKTGPHKLFFVADRQAVFRQSEDERHDG